MNPSTLRAPQGRSLGGTIGLALTIAAVMGGLAAGPALSAEHDQRDRPQERHQPAHPPSTGPITPPRARISHMATISPMVTLSPMVTIRRRRRSSMSRPRRRASASSSASRARGSEGDSPAPPALRRAGGRREKSGPPCKGHQRERGQRWKSISATRGYRVNRLRFGPFRPPASVLGSDAPVPPVCSACRGGASTIPRASSSETPGQDQNQKDQDDHA